MGCCRWDEIQKHIGKLEKRHAVHIASYGEGNERRLTGKHETSSMHDFRCALSSPNPQLLWGGLAARSRLLYRMHQRLSATFACFTTFTMVFWQQMGTGHLSSWLKHTHFQVVKDRPFSLWSGRACQGSTLTLCCPFVRCG
jgi:hypothetical protein